MMDMGILKLWYISALLILLAYKEVSLTPQKGFNDRGQQAKEEVFLRSKREIILLSCTFESDSKLLTINFHANVSADELNSTVIAQQIHQSQCNEAAEKILIRIGDKDFKCYNDTTATNHILEVNLTDCGLSVSISAATVRQNVNKLTNEQPSSTSDIFEESGSSGEISTTELVSDAVSTTTDGEEPDPRNINQPPSSAGTSRRNEVDVIIISAIVVSWMPFID